MNFETKSDFWAAQWSKGDWDCEIMLSFEPGRWGLPAAFERTVYGGDYENHRVIGRVYTLRLLCAAIHVTVDSSVKLPETVTG